jgi:hypothetical protein
MAVRHAEIRFSMFLRCEILEQDGLALYRSIIILRAAEKPM